PGPVMQIPVGGGSEPALEIMRGTPVQRRFGAGWIDLIAIVMTGAVLPEGDQPFPGPHLAGQFGIQDSADRFHHIDVAPRLARSDAIRGPRNPGLDHFEQRLSMILYEQPVA